MKKKLYIIIDTPLIKDDLSRYGVDFYNSQKIEVYFINLYFILTPNVPFNRSFNYSFQLFPKTWKSLAEILKKVNSNEEKILLEHAINHRTFKVFMILTLLKKKYSYAINWPNLPIENISIYSKFMSNKIVLKILLKMLNSIIYLVYNLFLKKPVFIFVPNKSCKENIIENSQSILIPYCTNSYDNYLDFLRSNRKSKKVDIVLIDQFLEGHPDFVRSGDMYPLTESKYIESINKITQSTEKIGESITIAYHPRRDKFLDLNNIKGYKGITYQLIENSKLIIANFSISIYWAVLHYKPIMIFNNNEIINSSISRLINGFANALNKKVINIDNISEHQLSDFILNEMKVDGDCYKKFIENYIVYDSNNKMKSFEIISRTLFDDFV